MLVTAPTRGRKQCPKCRLYIGVRSRQCECGHAFEKSEPTVEIREKVVIPIPRNPRPIEPIMMKGGSMRVVLTPSGECPAKLQGISEEQVRKWVDELQEIAGKRDDHLHPDALKYYARQFYDFTSPEYKSVCGIIDGAYGLDDD